MRPVCLQRKKKNCSCSTFKSVRAPALKIDKLCDIGNGDKEKVVKIITPFSLLNKSVNLQCYHHDGSLQK